MELNRGGQEISIKVVKRSVKRYQPVSLSVSSVHTHSTVSTNYNMMNAIQLKFPENMTIYMEHFANVYRTVCMCHYTIQMPLHMALQQQTCFIKMHISMKH